MPMAAFLILLFILGLNLKAKESLPPPTSRLNQTIPLDSREAEEAEDELVEQIRKSSSSFVFVGGGSGVCISHDGYILTNYHVVAPKKSWIVRVYGTGRLHRAELVGADPLGDLALLKIPDVQHLSHVRMADPADIRVGQWVLAFGDPFKLGDVDGQPAVSLGTLSGLHRYQSSRSSKSCTASYYTNALQTDAAVNPGNSGGPLLNMKGELLGLTGQIMARFSPRANSGIAYAIACDQLLRFLPLLKQAKGNVVYHGNLPPGMEISTTFNASADQTQSRVSVDLVLDNSKAYLDGFRAGDLIEKIQGEAVLTKPMAYSVIQSWPEDSEISFELKRNTELLTIRVRLPRLVIPQLNTQ